jgi:Raf kinase inhibitor-like YbhB/YbcL family protein
MPDLELTSGAFQDGEPIPTKYTCDGEDVSPPLAWSSVPEGTQSLALIVHDPDAPSGDFLHWLAWNIDPGPGGLGEGVAPPAEGTSGFGRTGYGGPCPPPGHGTHHYIHHLHALDTTLDLDSGAGRDDLQGAMEGHVLADGRLVGTYERE